MATNTPYPIYRFFRNIYPDPVKYPENYESTKEVGALLGAFILMKREAIENVGLLDELFFMYAEEVDWCYRVHKAGKKVIYFADAEIIHHRNQSAKKVAVRTFIQRKKSMILFFKKNHPELTFIAKFYILLCLILNIPFVMLRFLVRKDKKFNGNHYFAAISWMLRIGLKI
jgi:GT2 family glycosyltransferase